MKNSYYFAELSASYDAEIDDLLTDSEGNSALKRRLQQKRQELQAILPMIEFSPEMVVPVFFDAFTFSNPKVLAAAVVCEPDDGDFPGWDELSAAIDVATWARPLVDAVLAESAGEVFMVTAAGLEFIRLFAKSAPAPAADDKDGGEAKNDNGEGDDGDDDDRDLAEVGDDWLAEQGFDSFKS